MSQIISTVAEAVCGTARANNLDLSELQAERIARSAILATLRATHEPSIHVACMGAEALERKYRDNPEWETAKDVVESASVEAIWRAMIEALIREIQA